MRHLREVALAPADVLDPIGGDAHGGTCLFVGSTRADEVGGAALIALHYEADSALADTEIARVVAETEARFGVRAAAVHRIGRVPVGEASVMVAASAAHRDAAFDACRHLIDEIKARAPIWKRDVGPDGPGRWQDGRH